MFFLLAAGHGQGLLETDFGLLGVWERELQEYFALGTVDLGLVSALCG